MFLQKAMVAHVYVLHASDSNYGYCGQQSSVKSFTRFDWSVLDILFAKLLYFYLSATASLGGLDCLSGDPLGKQDRLFKLGLGGERKG